MPRALAKRHPVSALLICLAAGAISLLASACGTQKISVARSNRVLYEGAVLFNTHCAGCHSLNTAAARGSAAYVTTRQYYNGPNFNVRCERPLTRILYAIANGGFSGAIMPQNIVVGRQAVEVAQFISHYAGRSAPRIPNSTPCQQQQVGSVPNFSSNVNTSPATTYPASSATPKATVKKVVTGGKPPKSAPSATSSAGNGKKSPKGNKGQAGKAPGA